MADPSREDDPEQPLPDTAPADPKTGQPAPGFSSLPNALLGALESELIPRLLLSHLPVPPAPSARVADSMMRGEALPDDVAEFARLMVTHDVEIGKSFIQALRSRGVPLEKIYLYLLAPAARTLGEWWKEDLRNFAEVTVGLSRMRQLLSHFSSTFQQDAAPADPSRRVLLVPVPGEQHTFGLIMVAEFFRREGWDVWELFPVTPDELLRQVRAQAFTVIGLSLSCESRLSELMPLIRDVRAASRNQRVGIMAGGAPFVGRAELIAAIGADATATDGRYAPAVAAQLASALANRV